VGHYACLPEGLLPLAGFGGAEFSRLIAVRANSSSASSKGNRKGETLILSLARETVARSEEQNGKNYKGGIVINVSI